ncbi:feruloyl-CoA synthase [Desulfacinum hydrothermale DSM 13146]|uniref:Feruloyl-CoA synthase n=1 Tax=Desulfacinum hydrothermale DSM 13146 TaxID=1121390 RepID=A0A1W1WZ81_9BACT|nr:long-chain-fatty-acid--CoA ligase [Desulfacinum hydrothermale]SMC17046.1 feruloyl-CoA synthase [Desulfacinum hydrothermale DSM 13146]
MNLVEMVDRNARKFGSKDAIRTRGRGVSFLDLKDRAERAAGILQSHGIQAGDVVAIMSPNTPDFITVFFGAQKTGAAVVPVNHKLAAPEVDYILKHSGAKIFFFDGSLVQSIDALTLSIPQIALDSPAPGRPLLADLLETAPAFQAVAISDDATAEILYTSGTTGKPKGCVLTHRSVVMAAITGALAVKMDEEDRLLMAMPIWHSSPLNNWFLGASYVGATTVLLREYHPLHFLQAIQDERCTVYFGAPISYLMPLQMVPTFDDFDLSSMRAWIYGGGPIAPDTVRMLQAHYKSDRFYQVYGMTEAGPTGTVLPPQAHAAKAGSIGNKALPGADLRVMKSETEEAGPGETGEIWLKADSMMQGYLNDPEATRQAFHDGWYRTGDMARIDEDGYLTIVDRLKDMIVTGGENVYSKEVEDVLAEHPHVAQVAVIGTPHPHWGETVTAVVVPAPGTEPSAEALNRFLQDRLAKYKIPRIYHFVDALPHTPTGKVMKFRLREMF